MDTVASNNRVRRRAGLSPLVIFEVLFAALYISRLLVPYFYVTTTELRLGMSLFFFVAWVGFHFLRVGNVTATLKKVMTSTPGRWLLCWALVLMLNFGMGRGAAAGKHLFSLLYLFGYFLCAMMYANDSRPVYKWLLVLVAVVLAVQAAYSIPYLLAHFRIARQMMHEPMGPEKIVLASMGIGGYDTYLGAAIVLPLLWSFSLSRRNKLGLVVLSLCCLAILTSVVLSTFTAASVLAICGSGLLLGSFFLNEAGTRRAVELSVVGMLLVVASVQWAPMIVRSEQFSFVASKAERIIKGAVEAGIVAGDETGRASLAMASFRLWMENPIFGIGGYAGTFDSPAGFGGHSSWVDTLAQYGLIGGVCLFGMLIALGARARRLSRIGGARLLKTGILLSWMLYLAAGLGNTVLFMPMLDFMLFFVLFGASENAYWLVSPSRQGVSGNITRRPRVFVKSPQAGTTRAAMGV